MQADPHREGTLANSYKEHVESILHKATKGSVRDSFSWLISTRGLVWCKKNIGTFSFLRKRSKLYEKDLKVFLSS